MTKVKEYVTSLVPSRSTHKLGERSVCRELLTQSLVLQTSVYPNRSSYQSSRTTDARGVDWPDWRSGPLPFSRDEWVVGSGHETSRLRVYKSSPGYAEPGPSPSMRETAVMQTTAPPKSYDFARDALRVTVPSLD